MPKCAAGVPGCSLEDGTWIYTVKGTHRGKHRFVASNHHCHAPTCLSMSVYACAKGTPLEACDTKNGKLICRTVPVYGGTGHPAISGTRFDEPGYIAIPDCFWGAAEYGLEAPPDLTDVPLHIVKKVASTDQPHAHLPMATPFSSLADCPCSIIAWQANATLGHYGEMAGGQPWVF